MKKIKVRFSPYNGCDERHEGTYANFLYKILNKHFDVEISDTPEYLFYHESSDDHLNFDCVKIFYTGENLSPNFNYCDYAIGFDWLTFEDRYFRLPIFFVANFYQPSELAQMQGIDFTKQLNFSKSDLEKKSSFCSFVYSNYQGEYARKEMFEQLSSYKKVNAGGAFLNNVGGRVANKLAFETDHKFSITFENSSRSGYTTEKIVNALMAQTIPIYWGDPNIGKQFNTQRFINCHEYEDFEAVIERVKEIDANDELYLEIINQPIMSEEYDMHKVMIDFENFLIKIIDQPLKDAKRATINQQRLLAYLKREKVASFYTNFKSRVWNFFAACYQPFKKVSWFEKINRWIRK